MAITPAATPFTALDLIAQADATAGWFFDGWSAADMPSAYGHVLYVDRAGHVAIAPSGVDLNVFGDVLLRAELTAGTTTRGRR